MLIAGALLSALAALLHIGIIVFGAPWYRFFGAGERMACWVEQGRFLPHGITLLIALLLMVSSAFALSGAGLLPLITLTKSALVVITGVYLIRGIGGYWFVFKPTLAYSAQFALWSSSICLLVGLVHLYGLMQTWKSL